VEEPLSEAARTSREVRCKEDAMVSRVRVI
jgi:hypothetical protein